MTARTLIMFAALLFSAGSALADPYHYATEQVAEGVHLIYRVDPMRLPAEGNSVLIEQEDGLPVVDTGGSRVAGERILEQIREISDRPVTTIVITHWHGDHHLGTPAFLDAFPQAEVISHANTARHMTGRAMDYIHDSPAQLEASRDLLGQIAETGGLPGQDPLPPEVLHYYTLFFEDLDAVSAAVSDVTLVEPSQTYTDRLELQDATRPVELMHFGRGNTDGDTIIWLPVQQVVATGDLVVAPIPYGFGSYPGDWLAVLEEISALDYVALIPGHGPVQRDRAYVDRLAAMIADIRRQVGVLVAEGADLDTVRAGVDVSEHRAIFAEGDAWRANRFDAYWARPFVGVAYQEATGEPIVQGQ